MRDPAARVARPARWSARSGSLAFSWPLFVAAGRATLARPPTRRGCSSLLLPLLLGVVLAEIADGGMDAKAVAVLGVLAAVGAALRPLGGGVAGFEPVFFLLVLGGRVLGPRLRLRARRGDAVRVGAAHRAGSARGCRSRCWPPAGSGFLAGCLPRGTGRAEVVLLTGVRRGGRTRLRPADEPVALAVHRRAWTARSRTSPAPPLTENLARFIAFTLITSMGFDIPRAPTTAALVAIAARPVLLALRRAARRAEFEAVATFEPAEPQARWHR